MICHTDPFQGKQVNQVRRIWNLCLGWGTTIMRSDLFILFLPGFVFQYLKQAASGVRCRGSGMIRLSFDACTYSSGGSWQCLL